MFKPPPDGDLVREQQRSDNEQTDCLQRLRDDKDPVGPVRSGDRSRTTAEQQQQHHRRIDRGQHRPAAMPDVKSKPENARCSPSSSLRSTQPAPGVPVEGAPETCSAAEEGPELTSRCGMRLLLLSICF
jgi:hypothetical protein